MCGIVGILSFSTQPAADEALLARMRDAMQHRGPDGGASWFSPDRRVALGHRRLSIIDLSTAADQPMGEPDLDVWLTFNGEIYNHVELRAELIALGQRFVTDHSDTEVLLRGYLQWGIDELAARIAGDYAFGIWDGRVRKMYLLRDRIGVKPLYFSMANGRLIFASEMKAILQHPQVQRDIEPIAMFHYLSFLTTPAPLTMFRDIFKLPAGHYLEVSDTGALRSHRYWDAVPGQAVDPADMARLSPAARQDFYVQGVRERLIASVEKRMMSDVPFGVFLSGGIDSSTNVSLMSRFTDQPLRTFTVGFKDHPELNEVEEAALISREFATRHSEILIGEQDMVGYLEQLIYHQDEPIADWVCVPLHFLSKLAHDEGVTVVQVGEGSDELFCGYGTYMGYLKMQRQYWEPWRRFVPQGARTLAAGAAGLVAGWEPRLKMYAEFADRAARDREFFWTGATGFFDNEKKDLIDADRIAGAGGLSALVDCGLLPEAYLQPDSFNVVDAFFQRLDTVAPDADALTRLTYSEMKLRLPELLLMRLDKIGMSHSIEARVPFLDHDLVEFALDIPMAAKIPGGRVKQLLKDAVADMIPARIIDRKKMGFTAPMSHWMRGPFGARVEATLMNSRLFDRLPLKRDYVAWMLRQHRSGARDCARHLWTLFNLAAWYDYWIEGEGVAAERRRA